MIPYSSTSYLNIKIKIVHKHRIAYQFSLEHYFASNIISFAQLVCRIFLVEDFFPIGNDFFPTTTTSLMLATSSVTWLPEPRTGLLPTPLAPYSISLLESFLSTFLCNKSCRKFLIYLTKLAPSNRCSLKL